MATKDHTLWAAKTSNPKQPQQYKDLNLNQNSDSSGGGMMPIFTVSQSFDNRKTNKEPKENFLYSQQRTYCNLITTKKCSYPLQCNDQETPKASTSSDSQKSVLKIHIVAYDNWKKSQGITDDDEHQNLQTDEKMKRKKVPRTWKEFQAQLEAERKAEVLRYYFEFPRQQENAAVSIPEIAQFRASQVLYNPNNAAHHQNGGNSVARELWRGEIAISRNGSLLIFVTKESTGNMGPRYLAFTLDSRHENVADEEKKVRCRTCGASHENSWIITNGGNFLTDPNQGHSPNCTGVSEFEKNHEQRKNLFYFQMRNGELACDDPEELFFIYETTMAAFIGELSEGQRKKLKSNLWNAYTKSTNPAITDNRFTRSTATAANEIQTPREEEVVSNGSPWMEEHGEDGEDGEAGEFMNNEFDNDHIIQDEHETAGATLPATTNAWENYDATHQSSDSEQSEWNF